MRKGGFKSSLRAVLSEEEVSHLRSSLEVVGSIAVVKLPEKLTSKEGVVAEALMKLNKNIRTVLKQVSPVEGEFRLKGLAWVAGLKTFETVHREHGCILKVDVSKVYFSPRLQFERMRVAKLVQDGEVVVNMFAGVGSFSIVAARKANPAKVYSIDISPTAVEYLKENVLMNRVSNVVVPMLGDAGELVKSRLLGVADRVLMPLPAQAYEYLPHAVLSLKSSGGWVHYHDFTHAKKVDDPILKVADGVSGRLKTLGVDFTVQGGRVVRTVGPNWYQVVLDVWIKKHYET